MLLKLSRLVDFDSMQGSHSAPTQKFVEEFEAPKERHSLAQGEALGGEPFPSAQPPFWR